MDPAPIADIQAILEACKGNMMRDIRDKAIILLLFDTGMRVGELMALNLADIDLIEGSVKIRHPKNHKSRVVYFGRQTRRALRAWDNNFILSPW